MIFTYRPVHLGWVARTSGNPWVSERGSVLECTTRAELARLFGLADDDITLNSVSAAFREPLAYFQGMPLLDRIIKSLTTSQTFNSGVTLPVGVGELGVAGDVQGMPLACFIEPWAEALVSRNTQRLDQMNESLEVVRDPLTRNSLRYRKIGKLIETASRGSGLWTKPEGMGKYPVWFFSIGDTVLTVPQDELKILELAAYSVWNGFSQFATIWRKTNDFDAARCEFSFDPNRPIQSLETYMLAVDFMKDAQGCWMITDVGGLGGGAIADIGFCNRVAPLYLDPANLLAECLASYGRSDLNVIPPVLGMNAWEAKQLSIAVKKMGVPLGESLYNLGGLNILTSFKPEIAEVENPLPTAVFARQYSVPQRTYVLAELANFLFEKFGVGVPYTIDFGELVDNEGRDGAFSELRRDFGNWFVYRGAARRTGPMMIGDLAQMSNYSGVVLEKLCLPWLTMRKRTLAGDVVSGTYAAELRLYLGVRKND